MLDKIVYIRQDEIIKFINEELSEILDLETNEYSKGYREALIDLKNELESD